MFAQRKVSFTRIRQQIGWDLTILGKQQQFEENINEYWFHSTLVGTFGALLPTCMVITGSSKDDENQTLMWQAVSFCIRQAVLMIGVRYLNRKNA
jgi:hypothetical protein